MGREFIGDCFVDSELGSYEMDVAIKYNQARMRTTAAWCRGGSDLGRL